MKIIYLVPAVPVAMEALEAVLVGEDAVRVDSGADIARCGAGAEVFIVSGNLYGADEAKALKDTARGLKFVQTRSVGLDPFVRHGFPEGVIVCNARGVRGTTCAEHAVALLLGLARRIPRMERNRIAGDWGRDGLVDDVVSLEGRSVAVVGYGSIGRQVARRLKAFDMHGLWCMEPRWCDRPFPGWLADPDCVWFRRTDRAIECVDLHGDFGLLGLECASGEFAAVEPLDASHGCFAKRSQSVALSFLPVHPSLRRDLRRMVLPFRSAMRRVRGRNGCGAWRDDDFRW